MRRNKDNTAYLKKQMAKIKSGRKTIQDTASEIGTSGKSVSKWYREFIYTGHLEPKMICD